MSFVFPQRLHAGIGRHSSARSIAQLGGGAKRQGDVAKVIGRETGARRAGSDMECSMASTAAPAF
ncbi:hypothetical protein BS628_23955 [Agrobacterium radiobacter]|nr:hypothetical protein L902_24420 [Agrobacterium radiobacter DSM 30147]KAA1237713.1 hypothetical protein FHL81_14260 [Agrobacterium tumefaciens]OOO30897.1 hypothetical protein BS628_23955 [Agrobacterium radiobacter]TGE80821.1 hypothetical protein C9410_11670 [Rhizobium sp. SEMIA 439]KAB0460377.1 hypothetical protein F7R04_08885 [Agrobacterium tumefaciens]